MVMVTVDIPKQINKEIEHFKVEHELKDKRDAIIQLLKQCMLKPKDLVKVKSEVHNDRLKKLFRMADRTKRHNLTPEQIKAMDGEIYD